jgi:hypothetical protein
VSAPRYTVINVEGRNLLVPEGVDWHTADWDTLERLNGREVVLADDYLAAVEEVREQAAGIVLSGQNTAYEQGQRDAIAGKVVFTQDEWRAELARNQQAGLLAAVAAVEALPYWVSRDSCIAKIKAVGHEHDYDDAYLCRTCGHDKTEMGG